MPVSRARRVVLMGKKRKKAGGGAPAGGGGELMMVQETIQEDQAIPVISLFGWKVPLCSQFTWNLFHKVKA